MEEKIFEQLVKEFSLDHLSEADQIDFLDKIGNSIQKQFLLDVYDVIGEEKFNAIEKSSEMGQDFYFTTIKHIVPNYDKLFLESARKVYQMMKDNK